ncbi:MAG: cation-transporting P-type ATPase, partial [Chloroflexi bacterium]|nr:cation-transporting P-type ATPase [Chloroflexota bacterium]
MSQSKNSALVGDKRVSKTPSSHTSQTIAWHAMATDEVLSRTSSRAEGLSVAEAARRLAQQGRNEITRRKAISPWRL